MSVGKYLKSLDHLMTVNEAADKFKISTRYVRYLCQKAKLDSYKMGSRWLIWRDQDFKELE